MSTSRWLAWRSPPKCSVQTAWSWTWPKIRSLICACATRMCIRHRLVPLLLNQTTETNEKKTRRALESSRCRRGRDAVWRRECSSSLTTIMIATRIVMLKPRQWLQALFLHCLKLMSMTRKRPIRVMIIMMMRLRPACKRQEERGRIMMMMSRKMISITHSNP